MATAEKSLDLAGLQSLEKAQAERAPHLSWALRSDCRAQKADMSLGKPINVVQPDEHGFRSDLSASFLRQRRRRLARNSLPWRAVWSPPIKQLENVHGTEFRELLYRGLALASAFTRDWTESEWFEHRRSRVPIYSGHAVSGTLAILATSLDCGDSWYLATALAETLNPNLASSA